jgi:O-antigen/teichoic acid export membrane protein
MDIPLGCAASVRIQAQSALNPDHGECVTIQDPPFGVPDSGAQRLILRGGGSAGLGLLIRLGARLLFVFVAARLFGATLFGAYSVAVAGVELAVAVGGLGTKRILFKLLDDDAGGRPPIHIVLDAALAVLGASLALAGLIMGALALAPGAAAYGDTGWALFVLAPVIAGQALTDLFLAATRWKHRMQYEVVSRSIAEPYAAIAATLLAWLIGFRQDGLLIGYWLGTLAALTYAVWGARREFGGFRLTRWAVSRAELRAILHACAMPTLTDFASALFTRLDLYLAGLMLGQAPAGVYSMARQFRTPIRQVRQSFDGLLTPLIARTITADGPQVAGKAAASAARMILSVQLAMVVAVVAVGQPLLGWLGREFAAGYWALVLLAVAETIQGAFGVSDLILLYRRSALALGVTLVSAVVNLAAACLLIGPLGAMGAALAVLLAMVAGAIVRRQMLRRAVGVRIPLAHSAGPIISAMMAVAAGAAVEFWLPLGSDIAVHGAALAAALAIYGIALWAWLAVTRESLALTGFRTG